MRRPYPTGGKHYYSLTITYLREQIFYVWEFLSTGYSEPHHGPVGVAVEKRKADILHALAFLQRMFT